MTALPVVRRNFYRQYAVEIARGRQYSYLIRLGNGAIVKDKLSIVEVERDWPLTNGEKETPDHCARVWFKSTLKKSPEIRALLEGLMTLDVKAATTAQLVAFYNERSGKKPITRFSDRATAEKRCAELAAQKAAAPDPDTTPAKKKTGNSNIGAVRTNSKYAVTAKTHHLQAESVRRKVYDAIAKTGATGIYRETLESKLDIKNVTGYVGKLITMGYVKELKV